VPEKTISLKYEKIAVKDDCGRKNTGGLK